MTDVPTIRDNILAKLDCGGLPDHIPEKIGGGFRGGHVCHACDDPILMGQTEYTYELSGGRILRLHFGCSRLWQAELLRRRVETPGSERRPSTHMPTVTVSLGLLETLGVSLADVQELDRDAKRALEPLLASRGFNVHEVIHVSRLPRDKGFLLTQ